MAVEGKRFAGDVVGRKPAAAHRFHVVLVPRRERAPPGRDRVALAAAQPMDVAEIDQANRIVGIEAVAAKDGFRSGQIPLLNRGDAERIGCETVSVAGAGAAMAEAERQSPAKAISERLFMAVLPNASGGLLRDYDIFLQIFMTRGCRFR
jgi:hypothetical protein